MRTFPFALVLLLTLSTTMVAEPVAHAQSVALVQEASRAAKIGVVSLSVAAVGIGIAFFTIGVPAAIGYGLCFAGVSVSSWASYRLWRANEGMKRLADRLESGMFNDERARRIEAERRVRELEQQVGTGVPRSTTTGSGGPGSTTQPAGAGARR